MNIGPFSWWTLTLSGLCCFFLSINVPVVLWKHNTVGRRQLYRAACQPVR